MRLEAIAYVGKACGWCGEPMQEHDQLVLLFVHPASGWQPFHQWCTEERRQGPGGRQERKRSGTWRPPP